jgi:cytochrome b561
MSASLTTSTRYTTIAIALHWVLAALALGMIPVGWWMADAVRESATRAQALKVFPLHKAMGMTILALTLVRLGWRLGHRAPPLPAHMPGWEKFAARAAHWLFYAVLLAAPLSGWIYASAGWSEAFHTFITVPTSWFGLFDIPAFPGVAGQADEPRRAIGETAMAVHEKLAWVMIVLAGLHVAAALKHHLVDRDDVLTRMLPFLKPRT